MSSTAAALGALLLASVMSLASGQSYVPPSTTIAVSVASKVAGDQFFNQGYPSLFTLDSLHAPNLTVTVGVNYTFAVNVPSVHPFYIGTSSEGQGAGLLYGGLTSGNFTWTPSTANSIQSLYFQCENHALMGNSILVLPATSPIAASSSSSSLAPSTGSVSSSSAAASSVVSSTVSSTVSSVSSSVCSSTGGGSVSPSASSAFTSTVTVATSVSQQTSSSSSSAAASGNGVLPAGTTFVDVLVTGKVSGDPFFNVGFPAEYTLNGLHAPTMTAVRGTQYSFNVSVPAIHPFYLTTNADGAADPQMTTPLTQGVLLWTPNSTTPGVVYYQCEFHTNLGNSITVVDAGVNTNSAEQTYDSTCLLAALMLVVVGLAY